MPVVLAEIAKFAVWALTPIQRYSAMRRLETNYSATFLTNKWVILLGWSIIAVLGVLLIAVRRMRLEKDRRTMQERFATMANRYRLTVQEREMLEAISLRSGLKKTDAIFVESEAFDDGLAKLMQDSFAAGHNLAQRKRLNIMAYGIKTKLGFQKSISEFGLSGLSDRNLSSRQIAVGKTVAASLSSDMESHFEAEVVGNSPYELTLSPGIPLEALPGQTITIHYRIGNVTWGFTSVIISCGPQGLEVSHRDHIQIVNRRRFRRAPVQKKARVARFDVVQVAALSDAPAMEFVEAMVTEISGPGLRIRTGLDVKFRDRIIVIFELEPGRWIQDIAEVRGFRESPMGRSLVVELIGLSEQGVNDLIRVTNIIAGKVTRPEEEELVREAVLSLEQEHVL
jgi:hypothetical protein